MQFESHGQMPLLGAFPPRETRFVRGGLDEIYPDEVRVVLHLDGAPPKSDPDRRAIDASCTASWVDTWFYSASGPPAEATPLTVGRSGRQMVPYWLYTNSVVLERGGRRFLTFTVGGASKSDHYWSAGVPVEYELRSGDDEEPAVTGYELMKTLGSAGHLVISNDPEIVPDGEGLWTEDAVVVNYTQGAALLGRMAREQDASLPVGRNHFAHERLYLATSILDLLPSLRRYAEVVAASRGDFEPLFALWTRVVQVLLARDELAGLIGGLREPSPFRVTDALDRVMLFSLAAFDELAHSVHDVFGLQLKNNRHRKWNAPEFVAQLAADSRTGDVAALWAVGDRAASSNAVLRFLRNTVHGTGLGASPTVTVPDTYDDFALSAPVRHEPPGLLSDLRRSSHGGWGLVLDGDRMFVDPECLCEKVVYEAFVLLEKTLNVAAHSLATSTSSLDYSVPFSDLFPAPWGYLGDGGYRSAWGLGRLAAPDY